MNGDDADTDALDSETDAAVRSVVREELERHRADSPWRAVGQVFAGVLFALFVLQPLLGISLFALAGAGAPLELLAAASVFLWLGLVAYGWELPPFR